MSWQFTTNVLLPTLSDKVGKLVITLKNALVASGRWRVRGSGDGRAAILLQGQTASAGGSYDVFTAAPGWTTDAITLSNPVRTNTITNGRAWLLLEEIASGRVLLIQRDSGSSPGSLNVAMATVSGVPTSGATPNTVPALTGLVGVLVLGGWNATAGQIADSPAELAISDPAQCWLQVAVEDSVCAGGVTPWWFCVWSKTSNVPQVGGFWLSLTDVDNDTHPMVAAFGRMSFVFGTLGNATSGGLHAGTNWRGGNTFAACTLAIPQNSTVGAVPPLYQQPRNDGKWRTERPWLLMPSAGSRHIGRLEHFYLNKVARPYPATYDIAGAQPRLALGHLIVPWTAVVPESSP